MQLLAPTRQSSIVTGFTVEVALWSCIGLGSLALRVWNLGIAPLTNAEAANALTALALSRGESVTTLNPFFITLQSIVMSLFGASDVGARLPVVIAGALLCLMPVLLRPQINRQRTLLYGALLTLSPTLVFASRQAEGALIGWALALAAWCCWQRGWGRAALICVGLLLACGLDAVSPLIVLLAALVIDGLAMKSRKASLPVTRNDLILGAAAFLVASTGFLWRLSGLGDAFNGIAVWPLHLGYPALIGFPRLMTGSLIYEPLMILCATGGVAYLILRQRFHTREALWLVWVGLGLLLLGIDNSRSAISITPVVIGSAAFASAALAPLLRRSPIQSGEFLDYPRYAEAVVFVLSTVMLVYAYMGLSMYSGQQTTSWLFTILLGLLMVAGIGIVATLTYSPLLALRGISMAVGLCLLLYTFSTGYALTQTHAANPAEAYIAEAGDEGLRELVQTIRTISTRAYGDPETIPIQVLDTAPSALRWVLRDQRGVSYVARLSNAPAALTSINRKPEDEASYIGNAFRITSGTSLANIRCTPAGENAGENGQMDCTPLARWLTQRTVDERIITRWIFWLRSDTAQKANGQ